MKPYTYLIRWTKLNISYYGVRYAQDCNPSDLWNPYKTSSKYVAQFIAEHGEPDVIQVRKTFSEVSIAQTWEHRVLKRIKAVSSDNWLNRTDNKSISPQYGEDHPHYGKKGEAHHCYRIKKSGEFVEQQRQNWIGDNNPMKNSAVVAKKVAKTSGDDHHMKKANVVDKVSGKNNWIFKKPGALEARRQKFIEMNKARKGTQYRRVDCKHCGKDYSSVQINQHEKKCQINLARLVANTDLAV